MYLEFFLWKVMIQYGSYIVCHHSIFEIAVRYIEVDKQFLSHRFESLYLQHLHPPYMPTSNHLQETYEKTMEFFWQNFFVTKCTTKC